MPEIYPLPEICDKEKLELCLDEADWAAATDNIRYTEEKVFESVRKRIQELETL